jgi:hypothetical protein
MYVMQSLAMTDLHRPQLSLQDYTQRGEQNTGNIKKNREMEFVFVTLQERPPLWSSGQSSWLQIRRPGFDSRHYQKKVMDLERGPLSLVSTTEELLDRKVAVPVQKTENTAVGIRHADHVASSISKRWKSLRRQEAVARSV